MAMKLHSIILMKDSTFVEVSKYNKYSYFNSGSVLVLNNSDEAKKLNFFNYFYNKYTDIKHLSILITDLNGKVLKKLKKSDFEDISAFSDISIYTDNRAKIYKYVPTIYPYIINYQIEISSEQTAFLPSFDIYESTKCYILNKKFRLINKSDANIRYKKEDLEGIEISEKITNNDFSYEINHIKPFSNEVYSKEREPSINFSIDHFYLSGEEGTFSNWEQFGNWYITKLISNTQSLDDKVKAEVKQLIGNETDKKKIIQKIFQYVQNRTRYLSVSKGIGGWKPMNAMDVHKYGYGDCKALSNYTKCLLDVAGIESNLTLINASANKSSIDKDFASWTGNHIILNVPLEQDTLWLECTSQEIAYNQITDYTQDRNALSLSNKGSKIIHTPKLDNKTNKVDFITNIQISTDNKINVENKTVYKGKYYLDNLKINYFTKDEFDNFLKETYNTFQDFAILKTKKENDKENGIYTIDVQFSASNYCKKIGNDFMLKLIPFNNFTTNLKKDKIRESDLEIMGKSIRHEINYTLPNGYTLKEIPNKIEKQAEFGNYSMSFSFENNLLKVIRTIELFDNEYKKKSIRILLLSLKKFQF
ncbi:MAG: DUF3857 domain-containing protein [Saprospiraceae bacterium]|nr:DUF3857 domain-containing protein [Saprospiraceae bacterium]